MSAAGRSLASPLPRPAAVEAAGIIIIVMDSLEKMVLGAMDQHLTKRGLGYSKDDAPLFTDAQYLAFQQASLVCATVSLLLLSVTCYWFIRMKRSFRHQ